MLSCENLWKDILDISSQYISPVMITTWFSDAEPLSFSEHKFVLYVSDKIKYDIITQKFLSILNDALKQSSGDNSAEFSVIFGEEQKNSFISKKNIEGTVAETYTFDNFIVGNSNRFAQAAAIAVATKPAAAYNPLFIYGPSGLGKTHLLYAIANSIKINHPDFSIVYIKGDDFTNELITKIQSGDVESFRTKYRKADLLLVDDIQFVAGKERTQEEFFHTFNTLHESNKQIVLTSDRPPREMFTLEDRLKTRFEWGLLADIQPPDYETRVAIISKKAESLGVTLPLEISDYIAGAIKNNVRQLEGTVKKICAMNLLMHSELNLRLAEQAVRDIMSESFLYAPTAQTITDKVGEYFNIQSSKITGSNRAKELVVPRQIAMYLVRTLTNLSLPEIGREFNRDHSTVHHSITRIEELLNSDPKITRIVNDLTKNITGK